MDRKTATIIAIVILACIIVAVVFVAVLVLAVPTGVSKVLDDGNTYWECQMPEEIAKRIGSSYQYNGNQNIRMLKLGEDADCYGLETNDERATCLAGKMGVDPSYIAMGSRVCSADGAGWGVLPGCMEELQENQSMARLYLPQSSEDRMYDRASFAEMSRCKGEDGCAMSVVGEPTDVFYGRMV
jgi:hypothetical protein